MGLGLSICKQLLELMGGNIKVEPDNNRNSIFYFSIPFVPVKVDESFEEKNKDALNESVLQSVINNHKPLVV